MTENNRFTVPAKYSLSHSKIQLNGQPLTNAEIVRLLNTNDGAFIQNFALKRENKELKEKCENYRQALSDLGINVKILDGDVE